MNYINICKFFSQMFAKLYVPVGVVLVAAYPQGNQTTTEPMPAPRVAEKDAEHMKRQVSSNEFSIFSWFNYT